MLGDLLEVLKYGGDQRNVTRKYEQNKNLTKWSIKTDAFIKTCVLLVEKILYS